MIMIELQGERQLVNSLEGYDGWTVVAEGVTRPRHGECYRCPDTGRWKIDRDKVAEGKLEAMGKKELVKMVLSLEDRLTKIEQHLLPKGD